MKHRLTRLLLALLLCAALLTPTLALAEEVTGQVPDMAPLEVCQHLNKTPIQKPNGTYYRYDDPNVTSPTTTHAIYSDIYQYNHCNDCGQDLSGTLIGETFTGVERHTFVDGKCTKCGYECQHPSAYRTFNYNNLVFENVNDPYDHHAVGEREDYSYCMTCGARFDLTQSSYDGMLNHQFTDSICTQCGYECKHPTTNVNYAYSPKTYQNVGSASKHLVAGTRTVTVKCSRCSKVLSETTADASYFESHSFKDGKCTREGCGYVCPHEHVRLDSDDDEDEYSYKDTGDNKTHIEIYKQIKQRAYCEDCGCSLGEPAVVTAEHTYRHDYEDGVCWQCGHVNTCTHPNKVVRRDDYSDDTKYEKIDDAEFHNAILTYAYYDYCPDCDTWLSLVKKETETEQRPHSFDNKGVCYQCGYVKNCTHPNAFDREGSWSDKSTYEDTGSNATHLRVVDGWSEKYCPDCCRWLGNKQPVSVKYEESHDYNANGVCVLCGHNNACEHKRTYKTEYLKTTTGYTPVDASTHNRNGLLVTVLRCDDCGVDIETLSSVPSSETQPHDYNWMGICYDCGYHIDCAHTNVLKDFEEEPYEEEANYKCIDAKTHRVSGWFESYDLCLDCGKRIYTSEKYKTIVEAHNFNQKGVCFQCGFKRPECAHTNLGGGTMVSTGRATYKNIGHKLVHEATPVLSRRIYCEDCGKLIEDEIISSGETMLLSHSFDKNGVCKDCGYANTCAHANTKTSNYFDGNFTIKDTGSDATHEVRGRQMITEVYCTDCYTTISKTVQPYGTNTQSHYYTNGVCEGCGHVNKCAHANTETKTYIVGKVKDTGNNTTHQESGYKFEYVTCKDCGTVVSSKLVSKDATEKVAHKYVDNMCVVCGHVKTEEPAVEPAAEDDEDDADEETTTEAPKDIDYETVSEDTVVNGVKAADKLPVAEALKTIGETLDKEIKAEDVTVEIIGADEVMNKVLGEDKAKFDKLPMKDRMLVVLAALGLGDSVGEEAQKGMSDEAKALTAQIAENLNAMNDDEKQALLDAIAEFFPKTTVSIDGKDFEAFIIEVVVTRNGEKEYDRYTFYNDGTQWTLYSIERGTPVEATAA